MSEAELIDAVTELLGLHVSVFLAYLSIVSAYLVAAFMAGARLTSIQSITVSILFAFASLICIVALWGSGSRIAYLVSTLLEVDPLHPIVYSYSFRNVMAIISALGILASLKFMWDVRHPKE